MSVKEQLKNKLYEAMLFLKMQNIVKDGLPGICKASTKKKKDLVWMWEHVTFKSYILFSIDDVWMGNMLTEIQGLEFRAC